MGKFYLDDKSTNLGVETRDALRQVGEAPAKHFLCAKEMAGAHGFALYRDQEG
jgi:hypothetical protein